MVSINLQTHMHSASFLIW